MYFSEILAQVIHLLQLSIFAQEKFVPLTLNLFQRGKEKGMDSSMKFKTVTTASKVAVTVLQR